MHLTLLPSNEFAFSLLDTLHTLAPSLTSMLLSRRHRCRRHNIKLRPSKLCRRCHAIRCRPAINTSRWRLRRRRHAFHTSMPVFCQHTPTHNHRFSRCSRTALQPLSFLTTKVATYGAAQYVEQPTTYIEQQPQAYAVPPTIDTTYVQQQVVSSAIDNAGITGAFTLRPFNYPIFL